MIITIFDVIEEKILNYFDCPANPDPKRVKIFWKLMLALLFVCLCLTGLFFVLLNGDSSKMMLLSTALLTIGSVLMYRNSRRKAPPFVAKWWEGEGRWYELFIKVRR